MSNVITLDLNELADEWDTALLSCEECGEFIEEDPDGSEGVYVHDRSLDNAYDLDEYHAARPEAKAEEIAQLCVDLGLEPVEPDTLRNAYRLGVGTIVREDTFTEFAREYAESTYGAGVEELGWCIDWEKFARSMRQDYYELTYDGHEWLRRA